MGQQQLLLLVLGVVLVGLAVAVGVMQMEEQWARSHRDALATEAYAITGDVLAWIEKPAVLGGGNGRNNGFDSFRLTALGCDNTWTCRSPGNNPNAPGRNGVSGIWLYWNGSHQGAIEILIRGNPQETEQVRMRFFGPTLDCVKFRYKVHGEWEPYPDWRTAPAHCPAASSGDW
jgi:hypothetical protein